MKRRGVWLAGAVLAGLVAWWVWPRGAAVPEAQAAAGNAGHLALPAAAASAGASRPQGSPFTDAALRERLVQRELLLQRLERAKLALATYREQT
ncbi:MAG TPA: hypothetical protein VIN03_19805, partial [Roseateles sp.]